ncbi:hypothetical protein Emtol_2591 [Emticicia oligotrophica DSM 17448]|uniref:Uncharacterized protein n=1 Tax=Emticicia oligotrophica (strain DSM 17448 / CIP 109782 / MTCC 6937 / GPTSA100-15) TaxID=929562 RepID=A0ABN4AQX6_EMTOG|nr:hypothetical protein Emtol_2591 [Emticicia oligotrophica DSM 17448]
MVIKELFSSIYYYFYIVKATISKLLIVIYLLTATEASQLLKFPLLFSHFTEHQEKDPSMSFGEFLYHHYALDHADDGDAATDNKLPFKSHDHCSSTFVFPISIFHTIQLSHIKVIISEKKDIFFASSGSILSAYLSSIWQPPKY